MPRGGRVGHRYGEGRSRADTARLTGRSAARDRLSRYGERFLAMVHGAALAAGYKSLCSLRGGCSIDVVKSWFKPSRGLVMPGDVLCELLWRDDVLPEDARARLIGELCAEAGYYAFALPAGDEELNAAFVDAARELGDLAAALSQGSADGALDAAELERIAREAGEMAGRAMCVQAIARARLKKTGTNGTGAAARRG
jgi:hypothetical protein